MSKLPECIADAPSDVIEAAKKIARVSVNTIRDVIAAEFPIVDEATQNDFVRAICQLMTEAAQDGGKS